MNDDAQDKRTRRNQAVLLGALVVLLVAGTIVGISQTVNAASLADTAPRSESATPSRAATTTPVAFTPAPTPELMTYEFGCMTVDGHDPVYFSSFDEVWAQGAAVQYCKITDRAGDVYSEQELAAIEYKKTVVFRGTDKEWLDFAYESCLKIDAHTNGVNFDAMGYAEAAVALCPNAPHAAAMQANIEASRSNRAEREADEAAVANGQAFPSGSYRVGVEGGIPPGTYVSESDAPLLSCYWERLDSAGEIIDNNFATDAYRLEVTINASDYSFSTDGCGTWKLVS